MLDGIQIDPVAFTIPIGDGIPVYWYGIIVTLGIVLGAWWASREVKRRGGDPDVFLNGLIIVVISGYLFARLWYVLQEVIAGRGAQYDSLLDVVNLRAGGANILGGFIGALVVGYLYIRWKRLDFWLYADVVGPALLLAQGIGRWGNFINQELYGPPTTLPWGILIDAANRIAPFNDLTAYPAETRFHPTFLYESIWLLLGFVVLVVLNNRYRDQWRYGTLFGIFLIWWGAGRTVMEFFRPDQPTFGESVITYSMVLSVFLVVTGVLVILSRYDKLPQSAGMRRRQKRRVRKPKPKRETEPENQP